MGLFRVKYNFAAEDEGELSVRKGDLLRVSAPGDADEGDAGDKDGWTLVETLSPPFAKGYVPTNYIVKADLPSARTFATQGSPLASPGSHFGASHGGGVSIASSARPPTAGSIVSSVVSGRGRRQAASPGGGASVREKSPTRASRLAPIRRLSDPRLPQHLLETLETSDVVGEDGPTGGRDFNKAVPVGRGPLGASSVNVTADLADMRADQLVGQPAHIDLNKLFAAHDNWFEQVMEEREREFATFENSADSVAKVMSRVQEKSQDVVSKIMSLEAQVESQRFQLKQRIEDDNQTMNNRFAQLYT